MAKLPRKPNTTVPSNTEPSTAPRFTDSFGITYIGETALVRVHSEVKLSRNFNSVGGSVSLEFQTPRDDLDATIKKAFKKIRSAMKDEAAVISEALDHL